MLKHKYLFDVLRLIFALIYMYLLKMDFTCVITFYYLLIMLSNNYRTGGGGGHASELFYLVF